VAAPSDAASSGGGQAAAGCGKVAAREASPSQTDAGRVGGREHGGDVTGVRGAVQGMRGRASIFFGPCQPNPSFSISEGGFSLSCIGNPAHRERRRRTTISVSFGRVPRWIPALRRARRRARARMTGGAGRRFMIR